MKTDKNFPDITYISFTVHYKYRIADFQATDKLLEFSQNIFPTESR